MDLLNLAVRIFADDQASDEVDKVSGNIIGKLGKAAVAAGKALAGAFAVKKVVEFGVAAFDAYKDFEQLEGGVAKLYGNAGMELDEYLESMKDSGKSVDELTKAYERNEEAQKLMMQQASEAWKTAGVDANTYMEQATSMSAALISSLGGDTVQAAKQTDVAMRAISDNVNTFGTDMDSVSQAFMGFSKQNYTMLDNLKLGYGGTKTEMERLIADANTYAASIGQASDLSVDSFSDVVTAIELIQEKQGIAGTTTREAMSTIEGSMNATKAAWQNLVTEFGKPDADLGARIADMFTAVMGEGGEGGLVRNVVKEVGVIAKNMIGAVKLGITTAADWLFANGAKLFQRGVSGFVKKVGDFVSAVKIDPPNIVEAFSNAFEKTGDIRARIGEFVSNIAETITEWWPDIVNAFAGIWDAVVTTISDNAASIWGAVQDVLGRIGGLVLEYWPVFQGFLWDVIGRLLVWLSEKLLDISKAVGQFFSKDFIPLMGTLFGNLMSFIREYGPKMLETALKLFGNIGSAIIKYGPTVVANLLAMLATLVATIVGSIPQIVSAAFKWLGGMLRGLEEKWPEIKTWFSELPSKAIRAIGDVISKLLHKGREFLEGVRQGLVEKWPEIKTYLGGLPQKAFDAIGDVGSKLWQKGRDLLAGFWEGLKSIWKDIADWLSAKVAWAVQETNAAGSGGGFSGGGGGGAGDDGGGGAHSHGALRLHAAGGYIANHRQNLGPRDIVGDAGGEAIIPLTNKAYVKPFADTVAAQMLSRIGTFGDGQKIEVNIHLDYNAGTEATELVYDIASGIKLALGGV